MGQPVPECSNCGEPRAGGTFSDDGDVYLCTKCLAVHAEYFRVMAELENERMALIKKDAHGGGSPV